MEGLAAAPKSKKGEVARRDAGRRARVASTGGAVARAVPPSALSTSDLRDEACLARTPNSGHRTTHVADTDDGDSFLKGDAACCRPGVLIVSTD